MCDDCFGENLEKSTPIQVQLSHLCDRFQCAHYPPRAKHICTKYDSGSAVQVQSVQLKTVKTAFEIVF